MTTNRTLDSGLDDIEEQKKKGQKDEYTRRTTRHAILVEAGRSWTIIAPFSSGSWRL